MLTSIVEQKVKKIPLDFTDSTIPISAKILALSYLGLEHKLNNIGNVPINKNALGYIPESEFKTELEKMLKTINQVYINLASENITLKNKTAVVKAYLHQQIEGALQSKKTFEIFLNDIPHCNLEFFNYEFLQEDLVLRQNEKEMFNLAMNVPKEFDYGTILAKLLFEAPNKGRYKKRIVEAIKEGISPKRILTEILPNVNNSWYTQIKDYIKSAEKLDVYRSIFQRELQNNNNLGFYIADISSYNQLNFNEKESIHFNLVQNIVDFKNIANAATIENTFLFNETEFSKLEKASYSILKKEQAQMYKLIPRKGLDALLNVYEYQSDVNSRSLDELNDELSYSDYSEENYFDIISLKKNETTQQVFEIFNQLYPEGFLVHSWDFDTDGDLTYFLTKDGKITRYMENVWGRELLEKEEMDKASKDETKTHEDAIGNYYFDMQTNNNDVSKFTIEDFVLNLAKQEGVFHTTENILPIPSGRDYDCYAIKSITIGIREELDKIDLLNQLLPLGAIDNNIIAVEIDPEDLKPAENGRKYLVSSLDLHKSNEMFIYNGVGLVAKPSEYYFKVLGLESNASHEDIKLAYRKIVKESAPQALQLKKDFSKDEIATARIVFQNATEAYQALIKGKSESHNFAQIYNPYLGNVRTVLNELINNVEERKQSKTTGEIK